MSSEIVKNFIPGPRDSRRRTGSSSFCFLAKARIFAAQKTQKLDILRPIVRAHQRSTLVANGGSGADGTLESGGRRGLRKPLTRAFRPTTECEGDEAENENILFLYIKTYCAKFEFTLRFS